MSNVGTHDISLITKYHHKLPYKERNTQDGFKAVGKSMFDVEVVTQVRAMSVQYEMLKAELL